MKNFLLIMASVLISLNLSIAASGDKNELINSQNNNAVVMGDDESNKTITINNIPQNPEGIEYNKKDQSFFLSSLNAGPILKVNMDGSYSSFTSGEPYPMSTAGLQIDYKNKRLLAAAFNGLELMDNDENTQGMSNLRIYNLETGVMEKDINLSSLHPEANAFFANDIAIDNKGNAYISDWYAQVIYKVDLQGNASVFWKNETGIPSGPNGLDFHPDGYLLVSILTVNEKGLYANYGLVNIQVDKPKSAKLVSIPSGYTGFDGMVIKPNGNVVGITNDGQAPGGNTLIELSSKNNWETAEIINSKKLTPSTTVAITPDNENYIINQDFTSSTKESWTIEEIEF